MGSPSSSGAVTSSGMCGSTRCGMAWWPLATGRRRQALAPADVRVAFFGDLFRPPGTMAAAEPPYLGCGYRARPGTGPADGVLEAAVAQDPLAGRAGGGDGPGQGRVQVMLERLARSATFARVAQRAFIGNLKQVTAFLTDPAVKQDVLARVRRGGGRRTPGW